MILLWVIVLFGGDGLSSERSVVNAGVQRVYDAIVTEDGLVDYAALKRSGEHQRDLEAFAGYVAELDLDRLEDKHERIAVLANAYNVLTLIGVNRAYPVDSVRDIRPDFGFFSEATWMIAGQKMSLNDLENKLLRPLDNRIHFIINCASASCPEIPRKVLTRGNVETVMDAAAGAFLRDETRNRFDVESQTYHLSKIFEWFREDWGEQVDVIAFVQKYRPDLGWEPDEVTHLAYDWRLNEAAGEGR